MLCSDTRGSLINNGSRRNPLKVKFSGGRTSGWIKEGDLETSGLDAGAFEVKFGVDGRQKAMRTAVQKLPEGLQDAVQALRARVAHDRLPLLTMLQAEPMLMQSAHLSFQEFYCARALHKGMALPGENHLGNGQRGGQTAFGLVSNWATTLVAA